MCITPGSRHLILAQFSTDSSERGQAMAQFAQAGSCSNVRAGHRVRTEGEVTSDLPSRLFSPLFLSMCAQRKLGIRGMFACKVNDGGSQQVSMETGVGTVCTPESGPSPR